jgi:hypothetical protein
MERKTKITVISPRRPRKPSPRLRVGSLFWLGCFQLRDAIAVLELDRVLGAAPDDLDGHRLGLKAARQKRLDTISRSTERLLAPHGCGCGRGRHQGAAAPDHVPGCMQSGEHAAIAVADFRGRLGIESGRQSLEAKRWVDAAAEFRDKVFETGAERVAASRRRGYKTESGRPRSGPRPCVRSDETEQPCCPVSSDCPAAPPSDSRRTCGNRPTVDRWIVDVSLGSIRLHEGSRAQ